MVLLPWVLAHLKIFYVLYGHVIFSAETLHFAVSST